MCTLDLIKCAKLNACYGKGSEMYPWEMDRDPIHPFAQVVR